MCRGVVGAKPRFIPSAELRRDNVGVKSRITVGRVGFGYEDEKESSVEQTSLVPWFYPNTSSLCVVGWY